jgi:hypothetical protein
MEREPAPPFPELPSQWVVLKQRFSSGILAGFGGIYTPLIQGLGVHDA